MEQVTAEAQKQIESLRSMFVFY